MNIIFILRLSNVNKVDFFVICWNLWNVTEHIPRWQHAWLQILCQKSQNFVKIYRQVEICCSKLFLFIHILFKLQQQIL